jgi:hypothetical protein
MSAYKGAFSLPFTPKAYRQNPAMAPGKRSEEAYLWFSTVCEAIQEIPPGKVTSYAHIARLVGKRKRPSILEYDYTSLTRPQLNALGNTCCSARGTRNLLSMT